MKVLDIVFGVLALEHDRLHAMLPHEVLDRLGRAIAIASIVIFS